MPKPPPSNEPIPPNLPFVFRFAMRWTDSLTGQQAVNVLHIAANDGDSPFDVAASVNAAADAAMFGTMPDTVGVDEVTIEELVSGGSFGIEPLPAFVGSNGNDDGFIPAVSTLVSLYGSTLGQASRGRIYLPFTQENVCVNGRLGTSPHNAAETAWKAFRDDLLTQTPAVALVIYSDHYRDPTSGDYVAPNYQLVNSLSIDPILCTQRRRQDRVGL